MVWITQSEHHIYIKCPHHVRHLGFFPWGKVAWTWSQPLSPIILPRLCGVIHQSPPMYHHGVDWHTFLPCNLKYLLLACQDSTPGFSTSAFPCSQTQWSMFWDFPTSWKSLLKNNTGLCYITFACTTSNWSLEITTKHRKYARYGTGLETWLKDFMVFYYELFCLTYMTSINVTVFSVNSTH